MTLDDVLAILRKDNPRARAQDLELYAAAYVEHAEAQANITKHGSIVLHPRTGAPIPNPYLKIRDAAAARLARARKLRTDRLWQAPATPPAAE
jgi:phage terminase small subunit